MDDNIQKPEENQTPSPSPQVNQPTTPIFQTVPVEENLQPEEVAPEVTTPATEEVQANPEVPESPPPPMFNEDKKKYFLMVGGAILFLFLFFVVLGLFNKKKPVGSVKLTYWGLWEDKEVYDPLIKAYQKANPQVVISYEKMTPQEYKDKLLVRSKKGTGPDIFRFHNTWLPEISEVLSPLPKNIMSNADFEKTFYKIHQKDLKVGNYYYGIPLTIDGLVLIYNHGLLKKAGIDTPPANWDEVIDLVGKLTVKDNAGQIITAGIALGTATNVEHFSDIFGLMLVQNGGSLKNLDQPEAAESLESYRKFAESPKEFWNDLMPNSIVAFAQEKVAMIIAPSWQVLTIKAVNPDIDVKVTTIPVVPGGKQVSLATYWVEGVSRYSKNQNEAWRFLKFLAEKDSQTKLYQIESQLRPFGEAYSRVDLAPLLVQNPYLGAVIKQADYYISLPLASRTFDNGLNDEIIKYIENAINATAQGSSYSQALEAANQGVDQILSRYKME